MATTLAAPVVPVASPYYAPYVHPAPIYAPAPYVHHAPAAVHALPYHAAPIVKAVAAPLAQSYTSFSQVVTHPQPIVKVHAAEPVHYPVHYDPAPLKYTAAPIVKAAHYPYAAPYAAPYVAPYAAHYAAPYVSPYSAYRHHY